MAVDPFWDSEDDVPDFLKEHVTAGEDGKLYLQVNKKGGLSLENVTGLKETLKKANLRAANAEKDLASLKETVGDLDIGAARTAMSEVDSLRGKLKSSTSQEKLDALLEGERAKWQQKYDQDMAKLSGERDTALSDLDRATRVQVANQWLDEADVNPTMKPLIAKEILPWLKMEKTSSGDFLPVIVDEHGQPQPSSRAGSSVKGREELMDEIRERYPSAFQGTAATGSGASGGSANNARGSTGGLRKIDLGRLSAKDIEDAAAGKTVVDLPGLS